MTESGHHDSLYDPILGISPSNSPKIKKGKGLPILKFGSNYQYNTIDSQFANEKPSHRAFRLKSRDSIKMKNLDPIRGFLTDRNYIHTNIQSP